MLNDTKSQCQIGLFFSHSTTFTASGMAWVSKYPIFFLQINLFSFCARIVPKLSKFKKNCQNHQSSKKACFLIVFQIFSILGSILAQKSQTANTLALSRSFATKAILEAVKVVEWLLLLQVFSRFFNNSATWWLFSIFPKWRLRLT